MNKSYFSLFFLIFFALVDHLSAEFLCSADVRYKWKTIPASESNNLNNPKSAKPPANAVPTEQADSVDLSIKDVFWSTVEAKGATEEEAKNKLKILVNDHRLKADLSCREAHENQSKCLANKYAQHVGLQTALSYSQRRELEKKMVEDCQTSAGSCMGSASTEPTCKELVAVETSETQDAGKGKEKDKDKGAKKK